MSKKVKGRYKPVEIQDVQEPESNFQAENPEQFIDLPYEIVGNAKLSKFGTSINLDIVENGEHKFYVLILPHVKALVEGSPIIVHIRKYKQTEE